MENMHFEFVYILFFVWCAEMETYAKRTEQLGANSAEIVLLLLHVYFFFYSSIRIVFCVWQKREEFNKHNEV